MNKAAKFSVLLILCSIFVSCAKQAGTNVQTDALFRAVREGNTEMVKSLLSAPGVNVNVSDERGNKPLLEAARFGHDEICRLLIANGANVKVKDKDGNTALMLAIQNRHDDVVRVLKQAGETE
jgi:ankyrin repeat protein